MFDMHAHILANFDDGAANLKTSVEMMRLAWQRGTTHLLASPHVMKGRWLPAWRKIVRACISLNEIAQREKMNISIIPGAEIFMQTDIMEIIKEPGSYCINGGRYMLVELPPPEIPSYTEEFFHSLRSRNIVPVLAHPERHPAIARQPEILCAWIEQGIIVQVNAPSITGRMGENIMHTAEMLLRSNMVHCIGSDAHGLEHRRPIIAEAAGKIIDLMGQERANEILIRNPQKIIADFVIERNKIVLNKTGRYTSWFAKLFG